MPAPVNPWQSADTGMSQAASGRSDADHTDLTANNAETASPLFGPPAEPGEVGTLGPYRIVKQLGKGGMGAVYAAVDTRLNRRLALKVMLPKFAADPAAKERFLREARAAAQITHDNVVTVYEADERAGIPYIAMQFLDGYPLDEYLKTKGNLTTEQILRLAREAAAGLAAAHRLGLVHRDIKPGNLWLEAPDGRVKVLDFGLAKPVDNEVELTKSGAVVGTPAYMAPEQARGEKVDARADLFSLGAVLYRLCTGRLPFEGPTTMAVLLALATEDPPAVWLINPDVPEPLGDLIHQLLAKNRADRPESADAVVRRLKAIAAGTAEPVVPTAAPVRSRVAPIQVTASPDANPFADLDLTEHEPPAGPTPATVPARKKAGGKGPLITLGLLALAGVLVAGIVIIIKNRDGSETKIKVPDGSTVKDKGKTVVVVGPGGKKPPAGNANPDREVAEWVLSLGGKVGLKDIKNDIQAAADLPNGPFTVTRVDLTGTAVKDADLARLRDLTQLTNLHLENTRVTDAGLPHLQTFTQLNLLQLQNTAVTDAGLVHLRNFQQLQYLHLAHTAITSKGLAQLHDLKALTLLTVHRTKVTPKGLAVFHAAVPGCKIQHDGGVIEPIDVDRQAAEWVLSLGGMVSVVMNNANRDVRAAADLPSEPFTLRYILLQGKPVTDKDLARLKNLRELVDLNLSSTRVTDAGLVYLKDLHRLKILNLSLKQVTDAGLLNIKDMAELSNLRLAGTAVTDAGLAHLQNHKHLDQLNLADTAVTDTGLAHLKDIKTLKLLTVKMTKVTPEGLADFHAAVPGCKIEHDGGVIEPIDVERRTAEWVLSLGGIVRVNGQVRDLRAAAELPKGPFTLTRVGLANNPKVTDAGLVHLKDCKALTWLDLNGTKVTDAGLAHLKECQALDLLSLGDTPVTDAGLEHLKDCKALTQLYIVNPNVTDAGLVHLKHCPALATLNLHSTKVTDAGLVHLKACTTLTYLNVINTQVTVQGLADFRAAKPRCKIEHDGGVIEPKK